MQLKRILLAFCLVLVVGMVGAQAIHEADHDQDLLVDLTLQSSVGYQVYAYEIALEVEHRYLGEPFDLNVAVYDSLDNVLYDGTIDDVNSAIEIANDEYLVVFYVVGETSGRAMVRFNTTGTSHDSDDSLGDQGEVSTIYDWVVTGDVIEPLFGDERLCAQSAGTLDSMWFFHAPEAFVERVQAGYGDTLGFGLEQSLPNDATAVWLIVGNGFALEYALDNADYSTSYHVVPLRAGAGWVDVDGMLPDDDLDAEMFQQMLSDVTQVLIQGAEATCLVSPFIYQTTATAETVPYYVITSDEMGLPSGCEVYLVEVESGIPYSGDLAEDIRASLEALFDPTSMGEGNWSNYLGEQGLTVDSVAVEDGFATVEIGGTLMQIGTCVDGTLATQILLSVFNNPAVEGAMIMSNGRNMKPQFDMSDMTPEDEIYTPADFSLRLYR